VLLPDPKASYENSRHEGINSGMSLHAIAILIANVLHMVGFKFYRSFVLYSEMMKMCSLLGICTRGIHIRATKCHWQKNYIILLHPTVKHRVL
jgi:hypothetical protein